MFEWEPEPVDTFLVLMNGIGPVRTLACHPRHECGDRSGYSM